MRNLALVASVLLVSTACTESKKGDAPPGSPAAAASQPPAPRTGEALAAHYQQCWAAWNDRDWSDFGRCYADTATSLQVGMPPVEGKAKILETARSFGAAMSDAKGKLQLVLVHGREIASVVHFSGTHDGALTGPSGAIPATGRKVGYLGLHRVQLDEKDQVTREWWVFDTPTLMSQLGLSRSPARPLMEKGWAETPQIVVAKNDAAEEANVAAIRKAYDLWNARDQGFYDRIADDAVESSIASPEDIRGKPNIAEMNRQLLAGFSDVKLNVENAWGAGPYTFIAGTITGTHDGDLGPIRKTGKPISLELVEIAEWKDGKVTRTLAFMDGMQMAAQLGLAPRPGNDGNAGAAR